MAVPARLLFYQVKGRYGCFSNFSAHSITMEGKVWPTTEHYFQAKKFEGTKYEEMVRLCDRPGGAKRLGGSRALPLRPDWEEVKDGVMLAACMAKFSQNPKCGQTLLSTGSAYLVEHTKGDSYWADGPDGTGRNQLGKTLMQVRHALQTGSAAAAAAAEGDGTARAGGQAGAAAADGAHTRAEVVAGDLLKAESDFIVHQCNCVTRRSKGLATAVFAAYPEADVYSARKGKKKGRSIPGTASFHGRVINLYGQQGPGRPKASGPDTREARLGYFKKGLAAVVLALVDREPAPTTIAFPFEIGCGLAGGHWPDYKRALDEFALQVAPVRVIVCRLAEDGSTATEAGAEAEALAAADSSSDS